MLTLAFLVTLTVIGTADAQVRPARRECNTTNALQLGLDAPDIEQIEFGRDGDDGIKVRASWELPQEMKHCLSSLSLLVQESRHGSVHERRLIPVGRNARSFVADLSLDSNLTSSHYLYHHYRAIRDVSFKLVATLRLDEENQTATLSSAVTNAGVVNCTNVSPVRVQDLDVEQVSPGRIRVGWNNTADWRFPCVEEFRVEVWALPERNKSCAYNPRFGSYTNVRQSLQLVDWGHVDNTDSLAVAVDKEASSVEVDVVQDVYLGIRVSAVVGGKSPATELYSSYASSMTTFKSTAAGGCGQDWRRPYFASTDNQSTWTVVSDYQLVLPDGLLEMNFEDLEVANKDCAESFRLTVPVNPRGNNRQQHRYYQGPSWYNTQNRSLVLDVISDGYILNNCTLNGTFQINPQRHHNIFLEVYWRHCDFKHYYGYNHYEEKDYPGIAIRSPQYDKQMTCLTTEEIEEVEEQEMEQEEVEKKTAELTVEGLMEQTVIALSGGKDESAIPTNAEMH